MKYVWVLYEENIHSLDVCGVFEDANNAKKYISDKHGHVGWSRAYGETFCGCIYEDVEDYDPYDDMFHTETIARTFYIKKTELM